MADKISIQCPDDDNTETQLIRYIQKRISDLKPALDLDVSYIDERADVIDIQVTGVTESKSAIEITYDVTYDAYHGCKDQNHSGDEERFLCGERIDDCWVFDANIPREKRSTYEEF